MYSIQITKRNELWYCYLLISYEGIKLPVLDDTITDNNYSDLMVKVADKGWIDLINKNK